MVGAEQPCAIGPSRQACALAGGLSAGGTGPGAEAARGSSSRAGNSRTERDVETIRRKTPLRASRFGKSTGGSLKVSDVMTPDVEVVSLDDTLKTAAQLMADLDSERCLLANTTA